QIRALRGGFPFYGEIRTTPDSAAAVHQARGDALADASLLLQYDAAVGDSVRVGSLTYRLAGRLDGTTGQADVDALVRPRVYLPLDDLDPELLGFGARYTTSAYFRLPETAEADSVLAEIRPRLAAMDLRGATVSDLEGDWGDALGNLPRFLALVGFVALLRGGLGVATAIRVYVRQTAEAAAPLPGGHGRTDPPHLHAPGGGDGAVRRRARGGAGRARAAGAPPRARPVPAGRGRDGVRVGAGARRRGRGRGGGAPVRAPAATPRAPQHPAPPHPRPRAGAGLRRVAAAPRR